MMAVCCELPPPPPPWTLRNHPWSPPGRQIARPSRCGTGTRRRTPSTALRSGTSSLFASGGSKGRTKRRCRRSRWIGRLVPNSPFLVLVTHQPQQSASTHLTSLSWSPVSWLLRHTIGSRSIHPVCERNGNFWKFDEVWLIWREIYRNLLNLSI